MQDNRASTKSVPFFVAPVSEPEFGQDLVRWGTCMTQTFVLAIGINDIQLLHFHDFIHLALAFFWEIFKRSAPELGLQTSTFIHSADVLYHSNSTVPNMTVLV